MVDLERREVLDVLPNRSAKSTTSWLASRPAIEIVEAGGRNLALPQTPCCRSCTLRANQGDTWIHIRGVFFRVLDLAILRSAITQSDAGGPNTRARHHRGSATLDVGGMPSVLLLVAARS